MSKQSAAPSTIVIRRRRGFSARAKPSWRAIETSPEKIVQLLGVRVFARDGQLWEKFAMGNWLSERRRHQPLAIIELPKWGPVFSVLQTAIMMNAYASRRSGDSGPYI
jgi:hypothetical protein